MFCAAQSIDCIPDAQFRCTVHAGTCLPHPNLSETTRAIFASSAVGIIQPRITSSSSAGSKGCLASNCRPEYTAKSDAVNAPNMSGVNAVDQPRSIYLVELALEMAQRVLAPGGSFVSKVFQGEGFDELFRTARSSFGKVLTRKPKASRPRSREVYLVGKDFRGN